MPEDNTIQTSCARTGKMAEADSGNRGPDGNTLERVRTLLIRNGIQGKLFVQAVRLRQGRGLLLKKGTSMDSTLIPVPSSTNELLTGVEDASPDSGSSPAPKFGSCLAPQSS